MTIFYSVCNLLLWILYSKETRSLNKQTKIKKIKSLKIAWHVPLMFHSEYIYCGSDSLNQTRSAHWLYQYLYRIYKKSYDVSF